MTTRDTIVNFICSLPELTGRYQDVLPIGPGGGQGNNSLVFKARDGGRRIALKFSGPWNDDYRRRSFEREYLLLDKLRGQEGIIKLMGQMERIERQVRASETGVSLPYVLQYFPMEMARTDVATLIYSGSMRRSILQMLILFRATCRSVRRLHSNNICHRDIKPGNLLVFGTDDIRLGDLGTARELGEGVVGILENYDFARGDILYTAPELLCVTRECDAGFLDGDMYSLGAILFEIVTGRIFGQFVYSLEYLKDLASIFRSMESSSRSKIFEELLPDVIGSHPIPRLTDLGADIPNSIINNLEDLYQGLTELHLEKRNKWTFDRIFRELDIMVRILRWERNTGLAFRSRG